MKTRRSALAAALAALLVGAALSIAGVATTDMAAAESPAERYGRETGGPRMDHLDDLDPAELIGMNWNQLDKRLYTTPHKFPPLGDGHIRDFGGVSFSIELLDFADAIAPDRAEEFANYDVDFTIVSACSRYLPDEDAYALHLGIFPTALSTDRILGEARRGGFDHIMQRNTECVPPGPAIPLSQMN